MKKTYILLLASFALLSTVSCEKWLDVNPADEVTEEDLFKVGTGYRVALNGVYKNLSSSSLYGRELTWGMADVLGQCYDSFEFSTGHAYKDFSSFEYTTDNVKSVISSFWGEAYNAIANCNNIIGRIENESDAKFQGGKLERELILGEALALRGFIHFVVLTYFAPAPVKNDTRNWIPYYEQFPSTGEAYLPVSEVLKRVIRDLTRAYTLVEPFDTYRSVDGSEDHYLWMQPNYRFYANTGNGLAPKDPFYAYRGYRMNMAAITALLARVYSYAGENALAAVEAQKIVDMVYDVWETKFFDFTTAGDVAGDYKMCKDLIFALSDVNLIKNYETYASSATMKFVMGWDYSSLYDSESDYRKTVLLSKDGYYYKPRRYTTPSGAGSSETLDILPVIRLSEMYYILAENYAEQGDYTNATAMLEAVRKGRNCGANMLEGLITDHESFVEQLLLEARRDFTEEGLIFYYHKKFDSKFSRSMKDEAFYFPLPENETVN